jgi:UDP-N-acetyl-D-glucosamine dehydrogenase
MPQFVVDRTTDALNSMSKSIRGSKIGILGVAYKKDIDDPRESPSFKLMELLEDRGAILSYSDPHIPTIPSMRSFQVPQLLSEPLTAVYLESLDCVIIATDHSAFDYELILDKSSLVVDTRNAMAQVAKIAAGASGKIWKA